ncbi:MAG TPA: PEP-CTERM sorting domain-containing protein [Thiobacillus sp.]|nr:MAG: hypothetical protein B7Y21_11705 [Hydrogenophilales bacterium 16-61-112]OZA45089.1 MAG: hypothetical protein B7X81_08905 [Hydrogenophilales bacterium 17-61-76]HQT29963.1 PEP-CTERM sorting domain-containing protein [Thiobacillus sp.]HQT71859.1 PEP-CTERM sorting domain-containing protein [Thiobacillus sp.]
MNKKIIASAIAALGLAASGSASAIVVGGVDFGAAGETAHIETSTVAETFVNAPGQTLLGYGQINTVNGNLFYSNGGADRLYFVFDYNVLTFNAASGDATFDNGNMSVYMLPTFNLLNQSSAANLALITGGTLWATLSGHPENGGPEELTAAGILTGATIAFTGSGLLDMVSGPNGVMEFLDSNGIDDGAGGFADILLTSSGSNNVLNPKDNTTGCKTGQAAPGQWCIAGSADLRGLTTVPEPGVLALVGLGLLGMGVSLRKRKAA